MPGPSSAPRLTLELVPETCWYSNVRSLVDDAGWGRIRRQVYRQCNYRCEICGGRGPNHPVEAHEIWTYDDTTKVQTLAGMIGLCPDCHEVKHFGLANVRGRTETALRHLAHVNDWTLPTARRYVHDAFETWQERSQHPWQLDLSGLRPYMTAAGYRAACRAADAERAIPDASLSRPADRDRTIPPAVLAVAGGATTSAYPQQRPSSWTDGLGVLAAGGVLIALMLLVGWWVPLVLAGGFIVALFLYVWISNFID